MKRTLGTRMLLRALCKGAGAALVANVLDFPRATRDRAAESALRARRYAPGNLYSPTEVGVSRSFLQVGPETAHWPLALGPVPLFTNITLPIFKSTSKK